MGSWTLGAVAEDEAQKYCTSVALHKACIRWGSWLVQGRLRKMVIEMVLATDMKQHCLILSRFQSKLQVGPVMQQDLSSLSLVAHVQECLYKGFRGAAAPCGSMGLCTLALCSLCRDTAAPPMHVVLKAPAFHVEAVLGGADQNPYGQYDCWDACWHRGPCASHI